MDLRVIMMAPGFPPERLGGAEVHAERLARTLEEMGIPVERRGPGDPLPKPERGTVLHVHAASTLLLPVLSRLSGEWVPVITLHDVTFACPQLFYARATGEPCTARDARVCPVCMHRSALSAKLFYPFRRLGIAPFPGGAMKRLRAWLAYRDTLRRLHAGGARFIFPSRFVQGTFQELLGEPPQGLYLPNPPGVDPVTPGEPSTLPRVFGWLGVLSPGKGVDLLLAGWKRCGQEQYTEGRLVLWGKPAPGQEGWWERVFQTFRKVPGLEWRGGFSPEEEGTLLDAMDVLLFPSRVAENAPLVVVDALARGKRVLASERGGMPEILPEEALFPPTVEGVCEALRRANRLRPPGLPKHVPTRETYARRLVRLYEEVARGA